MCFLPLLNSQNTLSLTNVGIVQPVPLQPVYSLKVLNLSFAVTIVILWITKQICFIITYGIVNLWNASLSVRLRKSASTSIKFNAANLIDFHQFWQILPTVHLFHPNQWNVMKEKKETFYTIHFISNFEVTCPVHSCVYLFLHPSNLSIASKSFILH